VIVAAGFDTNDRDYGEAGKRLPGLKCPASITNHQWAYLNSTPQVPIQVATQSIAQAPQEISTECTPQNKIELVQVPTQVESQHLTQQIQTQVVPHNKIESVHIPTQVASQHPTQQILTQVVPHNEIEPVQIPTQVELQHLAQQIQTQVVPHNKIEITTQVEPQHPPPTILTQVVSHNEIQHEQIATQLVSQHSTQQIQTQIVPLSKIASAQIPAQVAIQETNANTSRISNSKKRKHSQLLKENKGSSFGGIHFSTDNLHGNNIAFAQNCKIISNDKINDTTEEIIAQLLKTNPHWLPVLFAVYKYFKNVRPEIDTRIKLAELWNNIITNNEFKNSDELQMVYTKFFQEANMNTFRFKNLLSKFQKKENSQRFLEIFVDGTLELNKIPFDICKSLAETFIENAQKLNNSQCALLIKLNEENIRCDEYSEEYIDYVFQEIKNCEKITGQDFFDSSAGELLRVLWPETYQNMGTIVKMKLINIIKQCATVIRNH